MHLNVSVAYLSVSVANLIVSVAFLTVSLAYLGVLVAYLSVSVAYLSLSVACLSGLGRPADGQLGSTKKLRAWLCLLTLLYLLTYLLTLLYWHANGKLGSLKKERRACTTEG